MTIKRYGGVFGRNPTFNNVTVENDLSVNGQLIINGNVITGLDFNGAWNASTNTPDLVSASPQAGAFWIVSVAGSTNLGGITMWSQGDWALYDGASWQRVEGGADLNSVNLSVSGTTTLSGLTASTALALNASKEIVSVTNTGTGNNVLDTSPTLVSPALGTPSALVGTNITGTASGLTAGNVTTNANLTGAVTSTGNATVLGSFSSANLAGALTDKTGTGFAVFATSPTLVTPALGVASATSINKVALTAPATGSTLTIADGKTLTANHSLTLAGTDATTMTFPTTNATIARTDAGQTFAAGQIFNNTIGVGGATPANTGSGVTFPALQSASSDVNTLDDYEEGTWTPSLYTTGTSPSITYTQQLGNYVKVGKSIILSFRVTMSVVSGAQSGGVRVNIPFSNFGGSSDEYQACGSMFLTNGITGGGIVNVENNRLTFSGSAIAAGSISGAVVYQTTT